jgi:hypothetical protein
MKHVVCYNGITYCFVKDETDERFEHFVDRVWWIVKNIQLHPNIDKTYIYNMSFIWSNVYHMDVAYHDSIMQELQQFTKTCY